MPFRSAPTSLKITAELGSDAARKVSRTQLAPLASCGELSFTSLGRRSFERN